LKKLADFAEQSGDALEASLYFDRPDFKPASQSTDAAERR
jgi:hypothetical protein